MKKSIFESNKNKLLRKDGNPYKYPRSACVGLLSLDNINSNIGTMLSFVEYLKFSMRQTLRLIREMSWDYLIGDLQDWDYPTDGIVVKLDDEIYSKSLGFTAHHPRGQIALKYGNPKGESILQDVVWSMGKDKLTPIGHIDPIILSGAEIRKVSLHNAKFLIDKDIKINDTIIIERSGDIIPHVVSIKPSPNRREINIDSCPICKGLLKYEEPELYCINENCNGKLIKKLTDSVKRIGIDRLGEPTIEKLFNIGIRNLIDILNLTKSQILTLPGFADTSAENLYQEIQRIRNGQIEDWKFLSALNIKGIGTNICKQLMQKLNLSELYEMIMSNINIQIEQIGPERSLEIRNYFTQNSQFICILYSMLNIKVTKNNFKFKGNVCFTGKSNKPREYWQSVAENFGYQTADDVNKHTTILITNDLKSSSGKMKKALQFNIQIMTYLDFEKVIHSG